MAKFQTDKDVLYYLMAEAAGFKSERAWTTGVEQKGALLAERVASTLAQNPYEEITITVRGSHAAKGEAAGAEDGAGGV